MTRVLWSLIFTALIGGFGALSIYSGARGRWLEAGLYLMACTLLASALTETLVLAAVAAGVCGGFSLGRVNR